MATINQIEYLKIVKEYIKEPILIMGSKQYEYDARNLNKWLNEEGFFNIIGVDIFEGEGVDVVADICEIEHPFFTEHKDYFNTIICMEVITHVPKPWLVGLTINQSTKIGGHVIMSECFVRKFSRMPKDYWRFTYDSFSVICEGFQFDDTLAMKSLTRAKKADIVPFNNKIFQIMHEQAEDETWLGFMWRKIHRKFFGGKLFKVSRLLPEQTFYAIGTKM